MKQAIDSHIMKLSKTIEGLKKFKATPIDPTKKKQILSERFKCNLESENFLYIIRTGFLNREEILKQFRQFKEKNRKTYKLSSINNPKEFNGVLYVGSSASIDSRLNQHLGHNGKRVYSLQLAKWFKISEIEIEIIPIDKSYSDILYPLENALWDFHKPLFGKKGTNVNSSINI